MKRVILGIESSCDETAAAVVENGRIVRSNIIFSQIEQHRPYNGVVPEIACRSHVDVLPGIVRDALEAADATWDELDAIAVTHGPGLASSLLVGVSGAKGLALARNKPLIGVNHLEGHIASVFLGENAPEPEDACPAILLLVSGGHSLLIHMKAWGSYELLGETFDDAAGEALDKGARLLGLSYPGGPEVEKAAVGGNPAAISFPRGGGGSLAKESPYHFSFSGLKTALLYHLKKHPDDLANGGLSDIAASYQEAVVDALMLRVDRALDTHSVKTFMCVGGVAKNRRLRARMEEVVQRHGVDLAMADLAYCTDNAAMIAGAAGRGPVREEAFTNIDVDPNLRLPGLVHSR
jgi:N6-L-threonylcarbamoyladenine synthase